MKKILDRLHLSNKNICFPFIMILVLLPFLCLFFSFNFDNDFWFTINQGRYVIENGFPIKAINVIHDIDFIYQSWGSGVLYYLVYHYTGVYGIIAIMVTVMELITYFYYKLCYRVSNNKRSSLIITIFTMILYYLYFFSTRPHIFTTLNLTIMLYLLESYLKTRNKKYLYFLPLISLMQINMHGIYFIVLLIILTPYLINSFRIKYRGIDEQGYPKKDIFLVFGLMLITGFINPYGYKTIIYGFSSYGSSSILNNNIMELFSPNFHSLDSKVIIMVIIIIVTLYSFYREKLSLRHFLFLIGTGYMAFDAVKSFWFFVFTTMFPLTCILFKEKYKENIFSKKYYIFNSILILIISFLCVMSVNYDGSSTLDKYVSYLDEHVTDKKETKIYNNFADGSYLEWRGYYCYIDPRAEIFLKSNNGDFDYFQEYVDVDKLRIDYREFVKKYNFDYLLLHESDSLHYLFNIDSLNYKKVISDDDYALYARNDIAT